MDVNKSLVKFIKIVFTILIVLLFVYIGVLLVTTAYEFGYRVFTESAIEPEPGQDVLIQIKDGMSDWEIGEELEEKGLVRDSNLFALQLKLSAYEGKLESGVYTLNTSMTPKEMIVSIAEEIEAKKQAEAEASTEEETAESTEGVVGEEEGTAPVEEQE